MQETRNLSADRQVRLSSGDIEILPKDYDSILFLSPARRGGYLISCFSLMSNVQRRLKNVEFVKLVSSGIRHPSLSNLLLLDSCFLILVTCLPACRRQDTSYLFPIPGGIIRPKAALAPPILFICFISLRMSSNCFIKLLTSVIFLPDPSAIRFLRLPSMMSGF